MTFDSTKHPISWLLKHYRDGELQVRPPYQRKPVWAARQKCYLIESILLGLPVPEIYVQQTTTPDGDTTYAIVDGQQRVRTILQFVGSERDPNEADENKFILDQLESSSPWRNRGYDELSPQERQEFYNYKIVVRYLYTDDDDEVRDMFKRLNKFLTPLKPQELRNATYWGPFAKTASDLADDEYWAENRIVTPAAIRRQNDVEFISELLIGLLHGPQGGSAAVIDEYYLQYEDFEDEFPGQRQAVKTFADVKQVIERVLPDIKSLRWSNKTDFYSLFVALGEHLRTKRFDYDKAKECARALKKLSEDISLAQRDEYTGTDERVLSYAKALVRGANDKSRRAARHSALMAVLARFTKGRPDRARG
jgi:hypothetical protein